MSWSVSSTLPPGADLEVEDAKNLLREAIRSHRKDRSARLREKAAEQIAQIADPLLEGVGCAAVYASRPFEPGTGPLLAAMHARGIRVLMPVLGAGLRRDWAEYSDGQTLEVRAPGRPPEPEGPTLGERAIQDADLIIAPALSVDAQGYRLGQGGGWYDRVLEHANPRTPIYALLYEDEISDKPLPRAAHDRLVNGVITPTRMHRLPRNE